jgi:hypothetical protein
MRIRPQPCPQPNLRLLVSQRGQKEQDGCPQGSLDFLLSLVALTNCIRLSSTKGAHANLSSTAWQEIGVKPCFGLSGIMALDVRLPIGHAAKERKIAQQGTGFSDPRRDWLRNRSFHSVPASR